MNKWRTLRRLGIREAVRRNIVKYLKQLLFGKGVLFGKRWDLYERLELHLMPVHFYSPIPDTRELRKNFKSWYREGDLAGVDFRLNEEIALVNEGLRAYAAECNKLPAYSEVLAQGYGEGFSAVDAHILHTMIRHVKPRKMIEVGSGVSTVFSLNALSQNNQETGAPSRLTCIEPYPLDGLCKLQRESVIDLVRKPVQEVSLELFRTLGPNDVLFIDSSHVLKLDSDVSYLYLEVLPNLNKDVIIHIHDISWPYPTPPPEEWIFKRHMFWTEASLLHAFLIHNSAFKILLCSSYLYHKSPDVLPSVFEVSPTNTPSSMWLQKIS